MNKKPSDHLPNILHFRWKHIPLFQRKVVVETIKRMVPEAVLEAVLEAQRIGIFMIIFSSMMHSCGMFYSFLLLPQYEDWISTSDY
jgi:hypothetical protein